VVPGNPAGRFSVLKFFAVSADTISVAEARQQSSTQVLLLVALDSIVFLTVGLVMWAVLPKPLRSLDWLIIGSAATLASLLVSFVLILRRSATPSAATDSMVSSNFLYTKRRRLQTQESETKAS
jgi:hypothetical protein